MKPRALILGDTLAGLVTAWRLNSAGFHVTILKITDDSHEANVSSSAPDVFYGSLMYTDSLLRELKMPKHDSCWTHVDLEFATAPSKPTRFPNPPLPAPWHTILGILYFSAFPYRQRWSLFNYIEKVWEGKATLPNSLDLQTAESWLTNIGQTSPVQKSVWDPLCRFLLGLSLSHARAGSFANILARIFFQSRHHSPRIPESPNCTSSLIHALNTRLEQQEVSFHQGPVIEHLQVSSEQISGVRLANGTILTADWYVSTLPPKTLTSLLSERLLARYSVFHQMSQHTFAPIVAFHALTDHKIDQPRLFLHPGQFAWTLCRAASASEENLTIVSCVSTENENLFSQSDEHITALALQHLERMLSHISHSDTGSLRGHTILRQSFGFTPQTPGSGAAQPSNQTPISNLFLSGSWTDTNALTEMESAITSGDICAQTVIAQNHTRD